MPSRRLRIAFVYDGLVPFTTGGGERRYHELASRLAERHDVHYVSWRFWGSGEVVVRGGVTYHGVGRPRPSPCAGCCCCAGRWRAGCKTVPVPRGRRSISNC